MGKLEAGARRKRKNHNFQKAVLGIVSAAGVISVAAVAPNALRLLRVGRNNKSGKYAATRALRRLLDKGLVERKREGLGLSLKGERYMEIEKERLALKQKGNKSWDGQWRVVAFDIPERRRRTRNHLRSLMQEIGFTQLQGSVWVFPYDCEELLALIKADLNTRKEVLYLVVAALEDDISLRKHFGLPIDK